jgi:DNA-binding LytR/AlgR family response regulator
MLNEVIFIPNKNRYERILKNEICFIEAQGAYVDIFLIDEKKYRVSTNLQQFIIQISDDFFFKVSRKHIINVNQVTAFQSSKVWFGEKHIDVSKPFRESLEIKLPIIRTKILKIGELNIGEDLLENQD